MFSFLKPPKLNTGLFISVSLICLLFAIISLIIIKNGWIGGFLNAGETLDSYNFQAVSQGDPLITKIPDLKEILAGPIISVSDPSQGPDNSPITIVEFSDFSCQYCQEQEMVLQSVLKLYDNKIKLIWKDYPENNVNSISYKAAIAGRCAQAQNQFWPYHDLLYQNPAMVEKEEFLKLADELNLKQNDFKKCLTDNNIKKLIQDNMAEANGLNITGIPFIYINDQEIMGQTSIQDIRKIIDEELNK